MQETIKDLRIDIVGGNISPSQCVGRKVKVGFVDGFEILEIDINGQGKPVCWYLSRKSKTYTFEPYKGLRCVFG